MSSSQTTLSGILTGVAVAVTSTQQDLDRVADASSAGIPFAPLAFAVKETQIVLRGNLFMDRESLALSQVDRVQASLHGAQGAGVTSCISVSIGIVEPHHGS